MGIKINRQVSTLCFSLLYAEFINKAMKKSKQEKSLTKVKQLVKQELKSQKQLKYVDTRINGLAITFAGQIRRWTPPVQGVGTYDRVGDQINIDHIEIFMWDVYGDAIGNVLRVVLIQTAGGFVPAALSNLFNWGSTGAEDVTSLYLPFIKGREIRVLYDNLHSLVPNATSAIRTQHMTVKAKLKLVGFNPGIATNTNGDLYWIFISDSLVIPHPAMNLLMRVWFTDP
jgi:hypothetical protein